MVAVMVVEELDEEELEELLVDIEVETDEDELEVDTLDELEEEDVVVPVIVIELEDEVILTEELLDELVDVVSPKLIYSCLLPYFRSFYPLPKPV